MADARMSKNEGWGGIASTTSYGDLDLTFRSSSKVGLPWLLFCRIVDPHEGNDGDVTHLPQRIVAESDCHVTFVRLTQGFRNAEEYSNLICATARSRTSDIIRERMNT